MKSEKQDDPANPEPGLLHAIGSVLAAAFGVQSRKNRERDFRQGKAGTFIVVGIAFTLALIVGIYFVVRLVLHRAGM